MRVRVILPTFYYEARHLIEGFPIDFPRNLAVFVLHKTLMDVELSGNYDLPFLSVTISQEETLDKINSNSVTSS